MRSSHGFSSAIFLAASASATVIPMPVHPAQPPVIVPPPIAAPANPGIIIVSPAHPAMPPAQPPVVSMPPAHPPVMMPPAQPPVVVMPPAHPPVMMPPAQPTVVMPSAQPPVATPPVVVPPVGNEPIQGPGIPIGSIITTCTVPGTFALTYDDGPFEFTTNVLDLLDQANIKATFFVNGNNLADINTFADVIRRMDTTGHQIGSHTFSHPDLATLGDADVITEMTRLETDLINIVGKYPTYMRPPFFSTNENTLSILGQLGYHVMQADIDTLDFANNNLGNLTGAVNFQAGVAGGGTISLAHDIHQNTAQVLTPEFIRVMTQAGLKGVTVGDCLGDPVANWYNATRTFTPTPTAPAQTLSITSTATPTGVLSPDAACGGPQGFVCLPGTCCSQFGFCGTTTEHCAAGCNPAFGVCGVFVPVAPAPVPGSRMFRAF